MLANVASRRLFWVTLLLAGASSSLGAEGTEPAKPSENLLRNGSFELGTQPWKLSVLGVTAAVRKTAARYVVDSDEAADGEKSVLVSIGTMVNDGVMFGQKLAVLEPGKVYTLSVMAKSAKKEPVKLWLDVQRSVKPWKSDVSTEPMKVKGDAWKELHATFKVRTPCPEGWTANVLCSQYNNVAFRLDNFRLYEGKYVPSSPAGQEPAPTPTQPKQQPPKQ